MKYKIVKCGNSFVNSYNRNICNNITAVSLSQNAATIFTDDFDAWQVSNFCDGKIIDIEELSTDEEIEVN